MFWSITQTRRIEHQFTSMQRENTDQMVRYDRMYELEVQLFEQAYRQRLPVMLTGPTGCGKTRLVEYMGLLLRRPLVTISCHDDLTSSDLVGRFMVTGGDELLRWNDCGLEFPHDLRRELP